MAYADIPKYNPVYPGQPNQPFNTIGSYMRQGQKPAPTPSWIKPRLMEQGDNQLRDELLGALRTWWRDGNDDGLLDMLHGIRGRHHSRNL